MSDVKYTMGLDSSGFVRNAGKAVAAISAIAVAAVSLTAASRAATASFNAAAQAEKTEVAIGTITKSIAQTKRVMQDVRDLSARTPFEMKDLAPAARALLGAGTATGKLKDQLRVLGDVAAGADTDIGGLVQVFNQVRGKGRLMGEEFLQFAERGVVGLREALAQVEGVSVDKVADSISRGEVSASDLEAAFRRMTSAGGIFFQSMERQSQTFLGKLSTLRDVFNQLLVSFGAPVNDALKPFIDDAGALTAKLQPVAALLGQQVAGAINAARGFLESLASGTPAVDALASAFGGLGETLSTLAAVPVNAMLAALPDLGSALLRVAAVTADFLGARLKAVAGEFGAGLAGLISDGLNAAADALPLSSINPQSAMLRGVAGQVLQGGSAAVDMAAKGQEETARILAVDAPAAFRAAAEDGGRGVAAALQTAAAGIESMARQVLPTVPQAPASQYVPGQLGISPVAAGMMKLTDRVSNSVAGPTRAEDQRALAVAQEQRMLLQQLGGKMDAVRGQLERINTR